MLSVAERSIGSRIRKRVRLFLSRMETVPVDLFFLFGVAIFAGKKTVYW